MTIPDYQAMMLPVLKLFANGAENVSQCLPELQKVLELTDEESQELLSNGRKTKLADRAHWARTYLAKAGLLESPKRNFHVITKAGLQLLATNPSHIDNNILSSYAGFEQWRLSSNDTSDTQSPLQEMKLSDPKITPDDAIANAHVTLNNALRDDLLTILYDMNPIQFERLILDLLTAMGYGKGDLSNSHMTKASGDGGIDGIIYEDALGLDAVYIQAKRYAADNKVSRPAIQQFVGSLNGEGATKGVFVTTSDFSAEAKAFLGKVQHRIVLINGQELARMMIRYDIGVRARMTYVIKSVDEDYFGDGGLG